jgi:LuxR family maltose regulon positive regulatory protein
MPGTAPLLIPKLRTPHLHASLITRAHLLRRLDAGLDGRLTLLSAPAGFGKTTLASQWIARYDAHNGDQLENGRLMQVSWVSLDAGDNDPVRFWRYVIAACQDFQADAGRSALDILHVGRQSPFVSAPLELVLTAFINNFSLAVNDTESLAARNSKALLVLEDYHVIILPAIHEMMTFLLDHLPLSLHIVIITRTDPSLSLNRLRARGDLHELHAVDLRFSSQETWEFLMQAGAFPLSPQVLAHVDTLMDGWVTGLRLASLALRREMNQQEAEQTIAAFSGSHKHVLAYFLSEVLAAQPERIQRFLLQTSMLDRLTGSLCDAVTEGHDGTLLLQTLEQTNLFLLPLDESSQWYRYHTLFSEAMQHEARRRLGLDEFLACHARASVWYEQQDMLGDAIEAALATRAFARAAALINHIIKPHHTHRMDELHTLRRWLETIPEHILGDYPDLCLRFAMLLLFPAGCMSDIVTAEALVLIRRLAFMAESFCQREDNRKGLGEVYAFRALLAKEQGEFTCAVSLARQALTLLPDAVQQWRGTCLSFVGEADMFEGNVNAARQKFLEAQGLYTSMGNPYATRAGLLLLGDAYTLLGELRQAAELYRHVLATAEEDLSDKARALLGLARLHYEWNDLQTAEQFACEASNHGEQLRDITLHVHASLVQVDALQARGELTEAQQVLRMLLVRTQTPALALLQREILTHQSRLQLAMGNMATVHRWSQASGEPAEDVPLLQREQEDFVLARLLIAQGDSNEAIRLLDSWLAKARQHGRAGSELTVLILMALARSAQQRQIQAASQLKEALTLAHAEGYVRHFLDEGEAVAILLRTLLAAGSKELAILYGRTLLRAFSEPQLEQGALPGSAMIDAGSLAEPLSQQEKRVLSLLVSGYTNPEIAELLVVSVNTVKTQVKSIYRKLNVNSRKEARESARSYNLH